VSEEGLVLIKSRTQEVTRMINEMIPGLGSALFSRILPFSFFSSFLWFGKKKSYHLSFLMIIIALSRSRFTEKDDNSLGLLYAQLDLFIPYIKLGAK
jgi:hypothetical protein